MNRSGAILMIGVISACWTAQVEGACFDIRGRVRTTNINETAQLGTIELSSGFVEMEGASLGHVTASDTSTIPIVTHMNHTVTFPGKGVLLTRDDRAELRPVPENTCIFKTVEQLNIVDGRGIFNDAKGSATAIGTVNACSGENRFYLKGNICTTP